MCRIQVTHFSLIENSFGNLHHLLAYPAGPWGWVYGKELSSFVFYTGTRSIRNDAHGRKNGDHQSSKDRVPLLHYTIDGRAKYHECPSKNFLDPWSGVQTAVSGVPLKDSWGDASLSGKPHKPLVFMRTWWESVCADSESQQELSLVIEVACCMKPTDTSKHNVPARGLCPACISAGKLSFKCIPVYTWNLCALWGNVHR